ncbi:MAG: glycine/betaine/sarcosine/D-proline family reductase selenoprotein B, partial [Firmicutes bacterium]|nr:glycine/betaine/sarcosine/D-proline family reductase selenoprotein B [Bacillota bacterium]
MAKEIERVGIPVVQVANMVPIAQMVGSNRVKRGNSIVCPLGDPE